MFKEGKREFQRRSVEKNSHVDLGLKQFQPWFTDTLEYTYRIDGTW